VCQRPVPALFFCAAAIVWCDRSAWRVSSFAPNKASFELKSYTHRHSRPDISTCGDGDGGVDDRGDDRKSEEKWSRREFIYSSAIGTASVTAAAASVKAADAVQDEDRAGAFSTMYGEGGAVPPFSSQRKQKHLTLQNGLRVLLVSDTNALRCTAALTIDGAGQFEDPIPGLAHMMEHMTLSSTAKDIRNISWEDNEDTDFEDWLADREGSSNGFTANCLVCFHFLCVDSAFQEALGRFASLFMQDNFEQTIKNNMKLRREVRRVDSELDYNSYFSKSFYLLKHLMNPQHPFARFSAGSLDTLERDPQDAGIDVSNELLEFYNNHYLPERAILVVVGNVDLPTLEKWVKIPFSKILAQKKDGSESYSPSSTKQRRMYPMPAFGPRSSKLQETVLLRPKDDDSSLEKLSVHWPLNIPYNNDEQGGTEMITAPTVGCIISQILGRRGPGSLSRFLVQLGWVPQGSQGVPRITFPVDVSGFQILKLEIGLTQEGFINRSAVVAAIFTSIASVKQISQSNGSPFLLSLVRMRQYISVATLHGYTLAPRPPDAIELAVDAQLYGLGGSKGVGVEGVWPLVPSVENGRAVDILRRAVAETLSIMQQPTEAIVIVSASAKSVTLSRNRSFFNQALPPISSGLWKEEPISGARYHVEDMLGIAGKAQMWVADKTAADEIGPPAFNPLIPACLRAARPILQRKSFDGSSRYFYLDQSDEAQAETTSSQNNVWRTFLTGTRTFLNGKPNSVNEGSRYLEFSSKGPNTSNILDQNWKLIQVVQNNDDVVKLDLPVMSSEPSCRSALVLQLISPRPARSDVKQGANAQIWLLSFEAAVVDLAALGAPGGLAYDVSFNKFGLRICFLGISQNLPSYARRFCRRMVEHSAKLLDEYEGRLDPSLIDTAVNQAKRLTYVSKRTQRQIIREIVDTTPSDAGEEGLRFLKSCGGGVCISQGDLLPNEAIELLTELRDIFRRVITDNDPSLMHYPELREIVYRPVWKPRGASPCLISGVCLVSDPCGRVPR